MDKKVFKLTIKMADETEQKPFSWTGPHSVFSDELDKAPHMIATFRLEWLEWNTPYGYDKSLLNPVMHQLDNMSVWYSVTAPIQGSWKNDAVRTCRINCKHQDRYKVKLALSTVELFAKELIR